MWWCSIVCIDLDKLKKYYMVKCQLKLWNTSLFCYLSCSFGIAWSSNGLFNLTLCTSPISHSCVSVYQFLMFCHYQVYAHGTHLFGFSPFPLFQDSDSFPAKVKIPWMENKKFSQVSSISIVTQWYHMITMMPKWFLKSCFQLSNSVIFFWRTIWNFNVFNVLIVRVCFQSVLATSEFFRRFYIRPNEPWIPVYCDRNCDEWWSSNWFNQLRETNCMLKKRTYKGVIWRLNSMSFHTCIYV